MERRFLSKVLTISFIPKFFSFILNSVTFPYMLSSLGTEKYGVFIYFSSIVIILELFFDFGLTSSLGKFIAERRSLGSTFYVDIIKVFFRIQISLIFIGLFVSFILFNFFDFLKLSSELRNVFNIMMITMAISVLQNFVKVLFQSLLQFESAVLTEFVESIFRSIIFVLVGLYFNSIYALSLLYLISCVLIFLFSGIILFKKLKILSKRNIIIFSEDKNLSTSNIFYQSFNFLWLRAATRLFHELPLILIKKYSGFELVGLIGAIRVFVGYIIMPFGIIGNAVMFRILEIKAKNGLKILWFKLMYFFSISICIMSSIIFLDLNILKKLISGFEFTNSLLIAFFLLVLSQVGFNIFAPPSDFLGGLKRRNTSLSIITLLQWPLIIILNNLGFVSIIYFYFIVFMNIVVLIAYFIISNISFFGSYKIVIESDFYKRLLFFFILCLVLFYLKYNIDFFIGNNILFFTHLGCVFIYFSFVSKERHRFLSELNEF